MILCPYQRVLGHDSSESIKETTHQKLCNPLLLCLLAKIKRRSCVIHRDQLGQAKFFLFSLFPPTWQILEYLLICAIRCVPDSENALLTESSDKVLHTHQKS